MGNQIVPYNDTVDSLINSWWDTLQFELDNKKYDYKKLSIKLQIKQKRKEIRALRKQLYA